MQKISVITVVFNDIDNIGKTINNVLKQTYQNLEYIVIDGASTDGTTEVVKSYGDRLKWVSEPDEGIYDAMMKGVRMASGEWIIFHNSGDFFYLPTVLEDIMSQYDIDKGEDFLIGNSRFFKKWGYSDSRPEILRRSYYEVMPVQHPSTLVRRKTQLKYPFHMEYMNSADYCFFVEAFSGGAKYRYFDIIVSLIDSRAGATNDHYEITLADNIDFLSKMGADPSYISKLQKVYKKVLFLKRVGIIQSIYGYYMRIVGHRKENWVKCEISSILSEI